MVRRGFLHLHVKNQAVVNSHRGAADVYDRLKKNLGTGFLTILCGPRGTGKTQVATSLACAELERMLGNYKLYDEEAWPKAGTASNIFRQIKTSFRPDSTMDEVRAFEQYSKPHLLVIDESQVRGDTAWEDRAFTDIIDRRYGLQRDTIVISNLTRAELPAALGPSIISRLHETGEVIECNWPSFREKK